MADPLDPIDPVNGFRLSENLGPIEQTPVSAATTIEEVIRNRQFQDVNAVTEAEKTSGAYTELHKDLNDLDYFGFAAKYGPDAANSRFALLNGAERRYEAETTEIDPVTTAKDLYKTASIEMYRAFGNLGTLAYGYATGGKERAAQLMAAHSSITDKMLQDNLSKELQDKKYFDGIQSQLEQADSQKQYNEEVAAGADEFNAGLRQVGRDFMNAIDRTTDSPSLTGNIIAAGIGSLYPSMALAGPGGLIAKGATAKVTSSVLASRVAAATGASVGAGTLEVAGVYAEAAQDIMSIPTEQLVEKSTIVQGLIAEGKTAEQAKIELAGIVAETAAIRQIIPSLALGFITSKFEAAPIGSWAGVGVARGLLRIAGEGIEETGQELSGTINKNLSVEKYAQIGRETLKGAGDAAAMGLIGGVGTAGTLAGVSGLASAPGRATAAASALLDTDFARNTGERAAEAAVNLGSAARDAASAIRNEIDPVVTAAADVTETISPVRRQERAQADANVERARVATGILKESIEGDIELDSEVRETMLAPDNSPVSEGFSDVISGNETNLENVAQIMTKMADRKFKMSDDDVLYAASQIQTLRSRMSSVPKAANTIAEIIDSKPVSTLMSKAMKIDLNKGGQIIEGEVTPQEVATTVALAKVNPGNVNPDRVNKILQSSGQELSAEDVKFLSVAQKIAQRINDKFNTNIEITKEQNVQLKKQGATPVKAPKSAEEANRSVAFDGYQSKKNVKLRSVNDFASDIITALQSPDQTMLNEDLDPVSLNSLIGQFKNLVTHLNNKVQALNESYDQNYVNKKGNVSGVAVRYSGLLDATRFVPKEQWKTPVTYHRGNPNSAAFAKAVQSDLDMAAGVYNELATAFPQEFASFGLDPLVQLKVDQTLPTAQSFQAAQQINQESLPQESDPAAPPAGETSSTTPVGENVEQAAGQQNPDYEALGIQMLGQNLWNELQDFGIPNLTQLFDSVYENDDQFQDWLDETSFLEMSKQAKQLGQNQETVQETVSETTETTDTSTDLETTTSTDSKPAGKETVETPAVAETEPKAVVQQDRKVLNNPVLARIFEEDPRSGIGKTWNDIKRALNGRINPRLMTEVENLQGYLLNRMNNPKILDKVTSINGKKVTVREHLQDPNSDIHKLHGTYGALQFIDPETGKYGPEVMNLIMMAVMDFVVMLRQNDPHEIPKTLEKLNMSLDELSEGQYETLKVGTNFALATHQMRESIQKMLGLRLTKEATIEESQAILNGLATEIFRALGNIPMSAKTKKGLFDIKAMPLVRKDESEVKVNTLVINPEEARSYQRHIAAGNDKGLSRTFADAIFGEGREQYSIGTPINSRARHQNNTPTEKAALTKMEQTPHFVDDIKAQVFQSMGREGLMDVLGYVEGVDEQSVKTLMLRLSKDGKNTSIQYDVNEAFDLIEEIKDPDDGVYYPHETTKVGRHQAIGVNYQNNKTLRALVTPTWETIDLQNQEQIDSLWLAIAQAADLGRKFKLEKNDHQRIINTVQEKFREKWGDVTNLVSKQLMNPDSVSGADLSAAILEVEPGGIEPQVLSAIFTIANLDMHMATGATEMRSSLSVELDGLTNGAANMMINMGQGTIDPSQLTNFQRVGFFLGKIGQSVTKFFDDPDQRDLYEESARRGQATLDQMKTDPKREPWQRFQAQAISRFASVFGDFENENMTRNSAKNPMTKINYGSGTEGVAIGIAEDMLLKFYEKAYLLEDNQNPQEFFNYPGDLFADMKAIGLPIPQRFEGNEFSFTPKQIASFKKTVQFTIGKALADSTRSLMGRDVITFNDFMVFSTNLQTKYIQAKFQEMLDVRLEELAEEGIVGRNKKGKPIFKQMPVAEYEALIRDLEQFAPIFVSDDQNLDLRGFERRMDSEGSPISASLNGDLATRAYIKLPELPGVKSIPYLIIGSGDAMMMNFVFSHVNAPNDIMGIFDGIDIPATKLKAYSQLINEQVMKTWERDVMGLAFQNFSSFVDQNLSDPLLVEAFEESQADTKKELLKFENIIDLRDTMKNMYRRNQARKAAFKELNVSVDQMGGSDNPFVRGDTEQTAIQINTLIQKKIDEGLDATVDTIVTETPTTEASEPTSTSTVRETTASELIKEMKFTPDQKKVLDVIRPLVQDDMRVVMGTVDEINAWRAQNLPDNGEILNAPKGMYDAINNIVFLTSLDKETVLHEFVHAATFQKVLAHYEGKPNQAIKRLEILMEEFLALESQSKNINEAKGTILQYLTQTDPYSKAAAINEFMAYGLSNTQVRRRLQKEKSTAFQKIAEKVVELMRRLMGSIPKTMFDHLVFNTKVIVEPPIAATAPVTDGDVVVDSTNTTAEEELSTTANRFTNAWLELIKKYLQENPGSLENARRNARQSDVIVTAKKIVEDLRQVGMLHSAEAQATFKAIYSVLNSEMKLNPNAVISLQNMYDHVTSNLQPDLFGSTPEAGQEYSAVLNAITESAPNQIATLAGMFALSQTSHKFRAALDQIPKPEKGEGAEKLSDFMNKLTHVMMSNITGSLDQNKANAKEEMNFLASIIVDFDTNREFWVLRKLGKGLSDLDNYFSGKVKDFSDFARGKNRDIQQSTYNKAVKQLSNLFTLGTNMLSSTNAAAQAEGIKEQIYMGQSISALIPIQELISEFIGTDDTNADVVAMLDKVNFGVQGIRQAYREGLPKILNEMFTEKPTAEQWKAMHNALARTDFAAVIQPNGSSAAFRLLSNAATRTRKIFDLERTIGNQTNPTYQQEILEKAQQLADYMNGKGAGKLLARNAEAILVSLELTPTETLIKKVDQLVSLYALDQMDAAERDTAVEILDQNPEAFRSITTYLQALNAEEERKNPPLRVRLNAFKGYIPNVGDKNTRIIVARDSQEADLKLRGFTKLKAFEGDDNSAFARSYYVTTTRQSGAYSQGVMQNVAQTYRGVDMNTGLSVTGDTFGFISEPDVVADITQMQAQASFTVTNPKEVMMPVLDVDPKSGQVYVSGYERSINPDIQEQHLKRQNNLAANIGAWSGRQIEEGLTTQYNRALIDKLDEIYQNRGNDDMFIDIKTIDDPIYRESFRLIPPHIKSYIDGKFDGRGFMIRQDMVNLSVGYREFSLADLWSGKTRLPDNLRRLMRNTSEIVFGKKAMQKIVDSEEIFQGTVSTAKDIIVIRSLIVPMMNMSANVIQLATRGVPLKEIWKIRKKLGEVERFNKIYQQQMEFQNRINLNRNNRALVTSLRAKIQSLDELVSKMSIAPIIEAGGYKQLSEGITELDVKLSSGKFGDYLEQASDKLPDMVADIAKFGLISKSTKLYKVANRATQYGDFLAKSVYYDHLIAEGLKPEAALKKMNEEFVNFSVLPGRSRSYLESIGATWFMAFKIRIAKIAMQQMRENPFRALMLNGLIDTGSPIQDNIFTVLFEDNRFDYATGLDMLFDAPELHPWVNLMNG